MEMDTIQPQTIVIRSVPTKTPTTIAVSTPLENAMLDDLYGDGEGGPRKRRRLTHLSPEEKLLRRKLKNRVAAQTARDRKKNQMAELEMKVAELERENQKLAIENNTLKAESGSLQQENESLKERLSTIGCSPAKTEAGTGSAARTGPAAVILGEDLCSFNADFRSDSLVSILKQSQEQTNSTVTNTVQLQSLPGFTVTKSQNSSNTTVVGPSTTELESLQELIQFDHVYYKTQPESKSASSQQTVQVKPKQAKIDTCNIQKVTDNGLKNVKIIITTDSNKNIDKLDEVIQIPNVILDTNALEKSKTVSRIAPKLIPSVLDGQEKVIELNDDHGDLTDMNFDLLNDLESILSQDCEGLTCSDSSFDHSQGEVQELTKCVNNGLKGQKRKAVTSEIAAIVDNLTADFPPSPTKSVYSIGDSDYNSDSPSPYNFNSAGSPISDNGVLGEETGWEESFSELFPDLV